MAGSVREVLSGITTVGDMIAAFQDEDRCRRLLEAMVWPRGASARHVVTDAQRLLRVATLAAKRGLVCTSVRTVPADFSSL